MATPTLLYEVVNGLQNTFVVNFEVILEKHQVKCGFDQELRILLLLK